MEAPTLDLKVPNEEKGDEVKTADGGELQHSDISVERLESTSSTVGNDAEERTETESAARNKGDQVDSNAEERDRATASLPKNKKMALSLVDPNDNTYNFPWLLCNTWKGMEELINRVLSDRSEEDEKKLESYDLRDPDGNIILPFQEMWEAVVEPGWEVTMTLKSEARNIIVSNAKSDVSDNGEDSEKEKPEASDSGSGSGSDSNSDSDSESESESEDEKGESKETNYLPKVSYAVKVFEEDNHGHNIFLYERTRDEPIILKEGQKLAKDLPILQEMREITHQYSPFSGNFLGRFPPPPPPPPPLSRFRTKVNKTAIVKAKKPHPFKPPQPPKMKRKHEKLLPGDDVAPPVLKIHSPHLLNALRAVIGYSAYADSGESLQRGVFRYPYKDLFSHKDDLVKYRNEPNPTRSRHTPEYNEKCDTHIDVLIGYLYDQSDIALNRAESRWNKPTPLTTFRDLWLILRPGSDVYVQEFGELNAYVIESVTGGVYEERAANYTVTVWNLDYNGLRIGRSIKVFSVPVFDGEREISSLKVFPVRFHKDDGNEVPLRTRLVERGKKFFALTQKPTYMEYTGPGLKPGRKKYKKTRVVIDHKREPWELGDTKGMHKPLGVMEVLNPDAYLEDRVPQRNGLARLPPVPPTTSIGAPARRPGCRCSECDIFVTDSQIYLPVMFQTYDNIDPNTTEELDQHQYFICAPRMYGFVLKDRAYDLLDISRLSEPTINENAIDWLVMKPAVNKETIKAICETYTHNANGEANFHADFIQGKGEGQIFLLHGPPGTGKTLTAECVAEYTRRPLISITAADLGHEPEELETNLLEFFRDANEWDAIVLLDEADVYLEVRSNNDLKRNSIVSIFLRTLDYFEGILFLTTNRVGSFDEAFSSRIHMLLGYDPLDDDIRGQIWDNTFRKLTEEHELGIRDMKYDYDAKNYVKNAPEVKELKWNGREIRNAFQTAVALAVYDARQKNRPPVLRESHLKQVVTMSAAFKEYIISTHEGMEDAQIAYRKGLRDDTLGSAAGSRDSRGQAHITRRRN